MTLRRQIQRLVLVSAALIISVTTLHAAERVSLRNGFDFVCDHRSTDGDRTRLFPAADQENFVEVATAEITAIEEVTLPVVAPVPAPVKATPASQSLTPAELHEYLAAAGSARNLDVDLLACVVHAESGGRAHAVSRAGAQGLMQLMPRTAADLGVTDSFQPDQNINGGTAYLNGLLLRYHDDLALALAAYNAGPSAVDKYHGVPPYRETRAYVARIIREFNERKVAADKLERAANKLSSSPAAQSD